MEKKPYKTMALGNGLMLDVYDISKKMAGDRWMVGIQSVIEVPIDLASGPSDPAEVRKALGNGIRYERKHERNFIEDRQKDAVLEGLTESLLKTSESYFSHPSFAARFIEKTYQTHLREKAWRK